MKARVHYGGAAFHKHRPGDYGFDPPVNPRPSKSLCDQLRSVLKDEAQSLLESGVDRGMFSAFEDGGLPKYIWAIDDGGEVYEAKIHTSPEIEYHGYRLGPDEKDMRRYVEGEWKRRRP